MATMAVVPVSVSMMSTVVMSAIMVVMVIVVPRQRLAYHRSDSAGGDGSRGDADPASWLK